MSDSLTVPRGTLLHTGTYSLALCGMQPVQIHSQDGRPVIRMSQILMFQDTTQPAVSGSQPPHPRPHGIIMTLTSMRSDAHDSSLTPQKRSITRTFMSNQSRHENPDFLSGMPCE